ncbi:MAG: glucan biosynthesis protein [Candidatus Omnitrophota bacterium]|nr:glucan biosynthesis protein [Candidatus Omnitrophota bacterium]
MWAIGLISSALFGVSGLFNISAISRDVEHNVASRLLGEENIDGYGSAFDYFIKQHVVMNIMAVTQALIGLVGIPLSIWAGIIDPSVGAAAVAVFVGGSIITVAGIAVIVVIGAAVYNRLGSLFEERSINRRTKEWPGGGAVYIGKLREFARGINLIPVKERAEYDIIGAVREIAQNSGIFEIKPMPNLVLEILDALEREHSPPIGLRQKYLPNNIKDAIRATIAASTFPPADSKLLEDILYHELFRKLCLVVTPIDRIRSAFKDREKLMMIANFASGMSMVVPTAAGIAVVQQRYVTETEKRLSSSIQQFIPRGITAGFDAAAQNILKLLTRTEAPATKASTDHRPQTTDQRPETKETEKEMQTAPKGGLTGVGVAGPGPGAGSPPPPPIPKEMTPASRQSKYTYDQYEDLPSDQAFDDGVWVVGTKPTGYFAYKDPMKLSVWDAASNSYKDTPLYKGIEDIGKITISHKISGQDSWPEILTLNGAGYIKFTAEPPLRIGASMRIGAHNAGAKDEEFPRVTEVRLKRLSDSRSEMILIVDSGIYEGQVKIIVTPGKDTTLHVEASYTMKRDVDISKEKNTGFLAFASMFGVHPGTNTVVHDTDFISVKYSDGSTDEAELANPADKTSVEFGKTGRSVRAFALEQRDRDPKSYKDAIAEYHARSSYIVDIVSSSIPMNLIVNTDHSDADTSDNVYPVVVPQDNLKAGQKIGLVYDASAAKDAPIFKASVAVSSRTSLQAAEEEEKNIKEEKRLLEIGKIASLIDGALEKYVRANYKDLNTDVKNYLTGSFLSDTMARNIHNMLSAKRDEGFALTREDVIDAVQKSIEKMKNMGLSAYLPFIGAPIIEDEKARESFEASVPIIKEQLTDSAQAIADELNAPKKTMPVQARPSPISPVIGETVKEAIVNPTTKSLPYTAIKPGLFNNEEYEIEYNTFRSPVYVKGNGFPFTKEGTGSGRFSPKDVAIGEERRGFNLAGVPYALLRKKSDGRVRILYTVDDIKTLESKGWKFTDEKEISYAELTLPDIFIKSLHNIDTHTRLVNIAKQQGIALTSENKIQLDLIVQLGLSGVVRGGAEIRFYLRNPKGKVIKEIAIQREEMQKLLRAEAVQDLLRIIYELQTRYIQAKENIINLEVQRDEYKGEIGKQARDSEKDGTVKRAIQKVEANLLKTEGVIRDWEVIRDSSVSALKNLMDLGSSDKITLSDDFTAIKAIKKSFDSEDKIRETLEPIGIEESAVGIVELVKQKEWELKQLDNALAIANKKLSAKVTLRAIGGTGLGIGSFLGLEFRRDKYTDPRVSFLAATNAMNEYEDSVKDAGLRKTMLGRKLDYLLNVMDNLNKALQIAEVNLDEEKKRYPDPKKYQILLNKVDNRAPILSTIAWVRKDFNDTFKELKDLEKGLTVRTIEMDEKFKLDIDLEKALEKIGQVAARPPAQKTYVAGVINKDIEYAKDHSKAIQSAKNNIRASERAREAKLAQIRDKSANPLKRLLKQRQAIEDEFQKMLKDDPQAVARYLNERKEEYDEIQGKIKEEVSGLLKIIERASGDLTNDKRATLKVEIEGPDAEVIDLANFGGKLKLRLGKTYYGEIKLLNAAVINAENEEKSIINTITDNSLRSLITLRDISSVIGKKRQQIVLLEKALIAAEALSKEHPIDENKRKVKDIELARIQMKALLENLHFLSDDALMRYKVILGLDPEASLDISGLLAMQDEDFSEYFKKIVDASISSSFNIRQPLEAMDNRIDTLKALKDIADEGVVIPVEIAVNTGGYYIPAEILNMRNRTGIKIGKLYAETALAKGENVRKDSRLILYHEMLIAKKNNSIAQDKVDLAKRRLDRANMDLKAAIVAKDKAALEAALDQLYAEMDVVRLEEELLTAKREEAHTYINTREKDPGALSAEFSPEASSPAEKITIDVRSVTSEDINAALDLDTTREVADITKKAFLWNS